MNENIWIAVVIGTVTGVIGSFLGRALADWMDKRRNP